MRLEILEDRSVPSTLNAPKFTVRAVSDSQINLAWTPVVGATSYQVEEMIAGNWSMIEPSLKTNTFAVKGLTADTAYEFDVASANSTQTAWGSAGETATTFPSAPTLTGDAVSKSEIDLSWNDVTGATLYKIARKVDGLWELIGSVDGTATSYEVTKGLRPGTTYTFRVGAFNASGRTVSNTITIRTLPNPPAAPVFALTPMSAEVGVWWLPALRATSYQIEEMIDGAWQEVGTTNGSAVSYAVNGLDSGTIYQFAVVAVNAGGATWGTTQSVKTDGTALYGIPTPNWSGYVISPVGQITSVGGTWVEPNMSKVSRGYQGTWVGLDGYENGSVEQLGTAWHVGTGYQAWIEFYGDGVQNTLGNWVKTGPYFDMTVIPVKIQAGDTVSAAISYVSSTATTSSFELNFSVVTPTGNTESWSAVRSTSYVVPQLASGEWIVEAPEIGTSLATLPNFGKVTFTDAWATVGNTTGGINDFTNYALNMKPGGFGGGGTDYTSSLTNASTTGYEEPSGGSSSFTITYDAVPNGIVATGGIVANSVNSPSYLAANNNRSAPASTQNTVVLTRSNDSDQGQFMDEVSEWLKNRHRTSDGTQASS